jgi:hypothetical protein
MMQARDEAPHTDSLVRGSRHPTNVGIAFADLFPGYY